MRLFRFFLIFLPICICLSCSDKDDTPQMQNLPMVTAVTSINGPGDNGYNDEILSGIMQACWSRDLLLSLSTPKDISEVEDLIDRWVNANDGGEKLLLILASNTYADLLPESLPENKEILLFESRSDDCAEGISTFFIRRYGVSYLAGCMSSGAENLYVIAANDSDATISEATAGFVDGAKDCGRDVETIFLAEDESGYSMPDKAYQETMHTEINAFIYPLAGGSNSGIFKQTREDILSLKLIAGMDKDCSGYSTRVPFSVVIDIRNVMISLIGDWLEGGGLQPHYEFGMSEDGVVDILINEDFYPKAEATEAYYDDEKYWENIYSRHLQTAIEKEEEYYAQKK